MEQKNAEICLIAPTRELVEQSKRVIDKYNKNISTYEATLADACALVGELIKDGAQVFISRKGTKKSIEQAFDVQIVEINLSLTDYIPIMEEAVRIKGKIAFLGVQTEADGHSSRKFKGIFGRHTNECCKLIIW